MIIWWCYTVSLKKHACSMANSVAKHACCWRTSLLHGFLFRPPCTFPLQSTVVLIMVIIFTWDEMLSASKLYGDSGKWFDFDKRLCHWQLQSGRFEDSPGLLNKRHRSKQTTHARTWGDWSFHHSVSVLPAEKERKKGHGETIACPWPSSRSRRFS